MDYKDYYATLGLPRTATTAEIKKAYRKLARQFHPDRNQGDAAAERRFKELNEANEVLADPAKRKQYDELGEHWQEYARMGGRPGSDPFGAGGPFAGFRTAGGAAGPGAGSVRFEFAGDPGEFSEFFRTFFAGSMAGASAAGGASGRRGPSRVATDGFAGASLDEILAGLGAAGRGPTGTTTPDGRTPGGSGSMHGGPRPPVQATVPVTLEEAFRGDTRRVEIDGRRLEVTIPAGVESGSRIRLRGQGGGTGEAARDLVLVVTVLPHPLFTRDGATLTRELPVTLREALLGAEVRVRTLDDRRLLLKVPAGTQPGRTIRLAGQGMPRLKGGARGDLLVRVKVVLPDLDEAGRAAAAAFLDSIKQPDPRQDA